MIKQVVVIPALAAALACLPGKDLFGQKILLSSEQGKQLFVVDMANNCSVEKLSSFTDLAMSSSIAMYRNAFYYLHTGKATLRRITLLPGTIADDSLFNRDPDLFGGSDALTVDKTNWLYGFSRIRNNRLEMYRKSNGNEEKYNPATFFLKPTGDMVFYKDRLILSAEEGIVEVDIAGPNSRVIIPTNGRVFPGLINVAVGCNGKNKVYGVETIGGITQLVEIDIDNEKILGVYGTFSLDGQKVLDAASPNETGETNFLAVTDINVNPICFPETFYEFKGGAYTPAGDSGITYTFSKGAERLDPISPVRGRVTVKLPFTPGRWNLTITSTNGCSVDTFVMIDPPGKIEAVAAIQPDTCSSGRGSVIINPTSGSPPFAYAFKGEAFQLSPQFKGLSPGDYTISILDSVGCEAELDFTMVTYTPPVPITAISIIPATGCGMNGQISVTYQSQVLITGARMDSDSFTVKNIFTGLEAGRHILQIKTPSCVFDTSITIPGTVPLISFSNKNADCNGTGGSSLVKATGITAPFTVSFNGGNFTSNLQFDNLSPGIYPVVVKGGDGCEWKASDTILPYIRVVPVIDTAVNSQVCADRGGSIKMSITGAEAPYRFMVDGVMYVSGGMASGLSAGTYTVNIYNASRCVVDTLSLVIQKGIDCDTMRALFIPSAFTPNGDGKNDILWPHTNPAGKVVRFVFRVYNRNGQIMFESRSPSNGWNGKYKGLQQPAATYVWVFEGIDANGKPVNYKGTTVLIR